MLGKNDSYYQEKLYVPMVNRQDEDLGAIERWEAHEKGLLHRGFSVAIKVDGQLLLQHRKHPVFDQTIDIGCSSHQLCDPRTGKVEDMIDAIGRTLQREWQIDAEDMKTAPIFKGVFYYKARDPLSQYTEHEMCHVYELEVKKVHQPDPAVSYGWSLMPLQKLTQAKSPIYKALTPWAKSMISLLQ